MQTDPISRTTLTSSMIGVSPLAQSTDFSLNQQQNARIIRHLEAAGLTTLLYGGNAVLAHITMGDYAGLLSLLVAGNSFCGAGVRDDDGPIGHPK